MKKDINSKFVQRYYRELTDLFYNKKIDLTKPFTKRDFNSWTNFRLNKETIIKFSNIRYLFVRAGSNMFGEHLFRAKYKYLEHFNIDTLAYALGILYPTKPRQKVEKQLTTAQKEVQEWQENKKKIEELKGYLSGPVEYLHLVIDAAVELEKNKDSSTKVLIKYITKAYSLGKLHGKI